MLLRDQDIYSSFYTFKRLLKNHIRPHFTKIAVAVFFMIIVAACNAILAHLIKPIVDKVFIAQDHNTFILMPLIIIILTSIKGIADYIQYYLIKMVGQKILIDLQMLLYRHLLSLDLMTLSQYSSGKLISRFTNDIFLMRGAVSNLLIGIARHFLSVVFLIIVMFNLEPKISAFVFLAFPAVIYPSTIIGNKIKNFTLLSQEEMSAYTSRLDETFSGIRIIKAYNAEKAEFLRAKSITSNIIGIYDKATKIESLIGPIMEIISGIAIAGVVWYGAITINNNATTTGSLFAFITAFISAYRPFKSLIGLNVSLQEGLAAAKRFFTLLDVKPFINNEENLPSFQLKNGAISMRNVYLNIGGRTILSDINLEIPPATTVAFVGKSGSGKTSIVNLLVKFYNATSGKITIDDQNLSDVSASSVRNHIALVTQDVILFDTTIAENIAYGSSGREIDMDKVMEAAKAASAHEFISALPDGYNSFVGYKGINLSGGQKQRISIARAFFRNAHILIMDEATSAIDPIGEAEIQNNILSNGKINIIVAHRLSTVINADKIFAVKNGFIVESGTHGELMLNKGEYYNLYSHQLKDLEEKQRDKSKKRER